MRGRVTTAEGAPVAGAAIWLSAPDTRQGGEVARSRENGTFELACVRPRSSVWAYAAEGGPAPMTQVPLPASGQEQVGIELTLGGPAGTILLEVVDAAGSPVPQATVRVGHRSGWHGRTSAGQNRSGAPAHKLTTDAHGRCVASGVPVGTWPVHVGKAGHAPVVVEVDVTRGRESARTVRLSAGGHVAGRILDAAGRPLCNATVSVGVPEGFFRVTARTDAAGCYRIDGAWIGRIHVAARSACEKFVARGAIEVVAGAVTTWDATIAQEAREVVGAVEFAGRTDRSVEYRVVARDVVSRQNLGNATVDASGKFSLAVAEAKPVDLTLWRTDVPELAVGHTAVAVLATPVRIVERRIDARTFVTGVLAGATHGDVIQADTKEATALDVDATCGRFRSRSLPAGCYVVHLWRADGSTRRIDIELHEGESLDLGTLR